MDKFLKDKFFIVDYLNYHTLKSRLYGYAFNDNNIFINTYPRLHSQDNNFSGSYVLLTSTDTSITISQDQSCSFGLYIFQKGQYWAVSNSFYLLTSFLSKKFKLTPNIDYLNLFLSQGLVPNSVTETAISEITELSSGQFITIDKHSGTISIDKKYFHLYTLNPLSLNGIEELDRWYLKYQRIYSTLVATQAPVTIDLSGGMDSRAAIAPLLAKGLDFDNVRVHSATDGLHTHGEDLEIAKEIATLYKFPLNRSLLVNKTGITARDSVQIMILTKFLFHDEFYYPRYFTTAPTFRFGGNGGEGLRAYWTDTRKAFIDKTIASILMPHLDSYASIKAILTRAFNYLDDKYPEPLPDAQRLYNHSRIKNHFGRSQIGAFLCNQISIQPLMDPVLRKFIPNEDEDILFALIFARFIPELKSIKFDGHRSIPDSVWEKVKLFDKTHIPLCFNEAANAKLQIQIELPLHKKGNEDEDNNCSPRNFVFNKFISPEVKYFVIKEYGLSSYKFALDYYRTRNYFPDRYVNKFYQVFKLFELIAEAGSPAHKYTPDNSFSFIISDIISCFKQARIDAILLAQSISKLEIASCSDENARIEYPAWFKYELSQGTVIQTNSSPLKISFIALCDGDLQITFRGIDKRDVNNKRIPLSYDIIDAKININNDPRPEFTIINHTSIWHDRPFKSKLIPVKYKDKIDLVIKFKPTDYSRSDLDYILDKFYELYDIDKLAEEIINSNKCA